MRQPRVRARHLLERKGRQKTILRFPGIEIGALQLRQSGQDETRHGTRGRRRNLNVQGRKLSPLREDREEKRQWKKSIATKPRDMG